MPPKLNTRSASSKTIGCVKIIDVKQSLHDDPVKGGFRRQAPTGVDVLGRVSHLTKQLDEDGKLIRKEYASKIVAHELSELWIHGLNVYPMAEKNIAKKILKSITDRDKLLRYSEKQKKSESWINKMEKFNSQHLTGFDIKTTCEKRLKELSDEYGVKMTKEEEELHQDNCKEKECSCDWDVLIKCQKCPRQMYSSDKVCQNWQKWHDRRKKKAEGEEKLLKAAQRESETNKYLNTLEVIPGDSDDEKIIDDSNHSSSKNKAEGHSNNSESSTNFPQIPIRTGRKSLNPELMLVFSHCLGTYKISENDLEGLLVDFANMVFKQNWIKSTDAEFTEEDPEYLSDEELSKTSEYVNSNKNSEPPKKKRKVKSDLKFVFPSRETRRKYLKEAALLNLRFVADKIVHKKDNQVVTWRFDDTKKSAGHRLYDVKTSNITVNGPNMKRQSYTTGFTENISHSGKDQAANLTKSLQILSVLASDNDDLPVNVQDIMENIDFWMSDRSSDGSTALELQIGEEKRLKCCAHTTLCVDESIDSVLNDVELAAGRDKLIGGDIGLKAIQSKNSIVTLGLIALCKGLSPSHAILPYSLYIRYKEWCKENNHEYKSFKGFQSNRFGRTAKMAELFLEHKETLKIFFNEAVDEKSNRLVQAMSTYIHSEWFELACEIYNTFGKEVIQPLCAILGIDEYGSLKREDRNWQGVKEFFYKILDRLGELSVENPSMSVKEKLVSRCALKIKESLKIQIEQVNFLKSSSPVCNEEKLEFAPLTNSGAESRFSQLDVKVKFSGGSAKLDTISDKQIVGVNKYLIQPGVQETAQEQFKWAHTSMQAKEAMKLQNEFLSLVKISKSLSLEAKKISKEKQNTYLLKLLATCQEHGGPITENKMYLLQELSEKQIKSEVMYLKKTLNADIKLRTRGLRDPVSGKFKFIPQTKDQLIESIRSVITPVKEPVDDINSLLKAALH